MWGRTGKAQSPWSARCSSCTGRPTSTCSSSGGVGASHPPQTPQQSQARNLSTYRLLLGSPHCSRRGSASVGRREGGTGNNGPPPLQRELPDRSACRVSPGGGHCLLEDKETVRKSLSHQPRDQRTLPPDARTAYLCHSGPPLPRVLLRHSPNHLNQLQLLQGGSSQEMVRLWTLLTGHRGHCIIGH